MPIRLECDVESESSFRTSGGGRESVGWRPIAEPFVWWFASFFTERCRCSADGASSKFSVSRKRLSTTRPPFCAVNRCVDAFRCGREDDEPGTDRDRADRTVQVPDLFDICATGSSLAPSWSRLSCKRNIKNT